MTTTPENTMYEDLVREYVNLEARIAPDVARLTEIKKVLRDLDYGSHAIANVTVSVARNTRLDTKAFSAKYPVLKFPHLYTSSPDSKAIKENLSPAEIRELSTEGEKRLTVK